jgi:NAD(P)-dependent dehydrogenase (short-subunit alcohol dehydrogenase family)
MGLKGKTAVVTGGGQGIGAAVVRALAEAGASVVTPGRTLGKLEQLAEELRQEGRDVWAAACDVSDAESIARLAAVAREKLGPIDILVNNAGIAHSAPIARTSLDDWERMLRVNATGAFLCLQAFLPDMVERKWGRIVNVASMAGLEGAPYIIAYTASKHALVGLTRAAAAEVDKHGVTVNAVCPGYVETPMTEATIENIVRKTGKSVEEARAAILATMPGGRMILPEEVAAAVLALVDDASGKRNGEAVVIDGRKAKR